MASPMLSLVCLLLILLINSAGGTLHMIVTPTDVSSGLTEALRINCTFTFAGVADMSGIIALVVSKSAPNTTHFLELASVNAFTPDKVSIQPEVGGTVSAHMDINGESYLNLLWPHPTANQTGLYKCQVKGVDNLGHPTAMFQTQLVTSQQPSLEQLMDKVIQLQSQLEQDNLAKNQSDEITLLQTQLERYENLSTNQSNEINILSTLVKNQSDNIDKLLTLTQTQSELISAQQSQLNNQSNTITNIQNSLNFKNLLNLLLNDDMFYFPSNILNGHVYLLSKKDWHDVTRAQTTCQEYGGYLAKITNDAENQFVKDFVDQHTGFHDVLMSGTDAGHEGRWTFTGTDTDLVFFDWEPRYPRTSQSWNCIAMWRGAQWRWGDYPCKHSFSDYKFLCEIETV